MKRLFLATACLILSVRPAAATFHVMVIDEVFFGSELAPAAQYVMLRMQAALQTQVYGQPTTAADAAGISATFGAFCSTPRSQCNLPVVSPACRAGDCPNAFDSQNRNVLIATGWAQGLFCVTADVLATGTIAYPSGRVCFGDCSVRTDCGEGPVDCVAYGQFTGDNGIFGQPALSPPPGSALVGRAERTNQFIGANLLDSASGFTIGEPMPVNFHGDSGAVDGVRGDADGDLAVTSADVEAISAELFEAGTRCGLLAAQRGADANFDTRVGAADVVAIVELAHD